MATPSIALIPSGYKADKIYSVLPSNGDGDFAFTRASIATRVNSSGLIETMATGVPRLDYSDGTCPSLLLEPQSTNLVLQSEDFSNAGWSKLGSSVVSGQTSPSADSPTGAYKLVEDTATSNHRVKYRLDSSSNIHTGSVFVKAGERTKVGIQEGGVTNSYASFNLSTGVVIDSSGASTYSIQLISNGWYKISLTPNSAQVRYDLNVTILDDSYTSGLPNSATYTGDGVSGLYIWGAQLEALSYPTSYIKTVGTSVTRVTETATGSGTVSDINSEEGTIFVEISALADDGTNRRISISDGNANNQNEMIIGYHPNSNTVQYFLRVGNVIIVNQIQSVSSTTEFLKIAVKWKLNDFALWINGVEVYSLGTGIIYAAGVLNTLSFSEANSANPFYGKTKDLRVYKTALSDAELIDLTNFTDSTFTSLANRLNYNII